MEQKEKLSAEKCPLFYEEECWIIDENPWITLFTDEKTWIKNHEKKNIRKNINLNKNENSENPFICNSKLTFLSVTFYC